MKLSPKTKTWAAAIHQIWPLHRNIINAWTLLALFLALGIAQLPAQDDDYMTIYSQIQQADDLASSGKAVRAHNLYLQAKQSLAAFKQNYPDWNTSTVNYRLKYLDDKIAATSGNASATATASGSASGASTTSDMTPDSASDSAAPVVKLIDAGSEPRKVLSLHPAVGDKQSMTLTTKMSMSMTMGQNSMPAMDIPGTTQTMEVTVQDVAADGEITYAMTFGAPTVEDTGGANAMMVNAMKTAMAGMAGMTGTAKVSNHGVTRDIHLTLPPGASPQLSQQLGQIKDTISQAATSLPTEAVGVGAKWESTTRVKTQGMTINQTADFTLVSADGDNLMIQSTIHQSAANQSVESPAMPGMKVNLTKFAGTGNSTANFNLAHILPQNVTLDEDIAMQMSLGQQGQMDMKMKMKMSMQSQ